jgi:hypothetical protein
MIEYWWDRVRTRTRLATTDVSIPGTGWRRLQLIDGVEPSDGVAWEIRQKDDCWFLFSSRVTENMPELFLIGYEPTPFDSAALASYYNRIATLSLPLSPHLGDQLGLDGDMTQIAIFGGLYSECRFQWWSEPPPQWLPLVDIASEMAEAFSAVLEH